MTSQKPKSLQDILKEKRKEESREVFVGRGDEVSRFRENLLLPAEEGRLFLFNPYGQGGVGKTFLLRRFQQIADEQRILGAWSNDDQRNIVEVMARLSEELKSKGFALESFDDRYRTYRQKRAELESDPALPAGFFEFLGRTATKAGLWAGAQALGGGVLLPFITPDELASKMGEGLAFVASKLKKDDAQLVQEPIAVLTPLWLTDLQKVCERRSLILFFDAYERTAGFLDDWLRDVIRGDYGQTSLNLLFVVAGQVELPWDAWRDYEQIISRMPLEPFTEEETRSFLARKGLTDTRVAADIFHSTKGLPVLVALLATVKPGEEGSFDPHATAIERFLKGVEPRYRQVALDAALPRRLNRDVLSELTGAENADAFFNWLKRMPFVRQRAEGWEYHAVVRHLMLVYKRRESPEGWAGLHRRMENYYERLQNRLALSASRRIQDSVWREYSLEVLYHRRCESSHRALGFALEGFLAALKFQRAFAHEWAETLQDAEEDAPGPEELCWGEQLTEALNAIEEARFSEAIGTFTQLVGRDDLGKEWRAIALDWRGYLYRMGRQLESALQDFSAAIELIPDDGEYLADRGWLLFSLKRYPEALADLDRAVAANPSAPRYLAMRGLLLEVLARPEDADVDLKRAMALEPQSTILAHHQMMLALIRKDQAQMAAAFTRLTDQAHQFIEALRETLKSVPPDTAFDEIQAFFDAIGLPPGTALQQDFRQHFAELTQGNADSLATKLKASAAALQSANYKQNAEPERALTAIEKAIELAPHDAQYRLIKADLQAQMGRDEMALAEFDQAAMLSPQSTEVFSRRGGFHFSKGRFIEAIADYSCAIKLAPNSSLFVQRSALYRLTGNYQEALADLQNAMALRPNDLLLLYQRAPLQSALQDHAGLAETANKLAEQAEIFINQLKTSVAKSDPAQQSTNIQNWLLSAGFGFENPAELAERLTTIAQSDVATGIRILQADAAALESAIHLEKKELPQALASIERALSLEPENSSHWATKAETHRQMRQYSDAVSDLNHALTLRPDSAKFHLARGRLHLQMKRFEEVLVDTEKVLALQPEMGIAHAMRGDALTSMGRYTEALDEVSHALQQNPTFLPALTTRSFLYLVQERYEESLKDLEQLAASLNPIPTNFQNARGELLSRLGRYDEAMDVYRQILKKEPGNWRAAYNLVVLRARMEGTLAVGDELAEILGQLKTVLVDDRASALVRLGGLEALTDNTERAFEFLQEANSLDPHIIHWVKGDLAWSSLWRDPRFLALLGQMNTQPSSG
ncbi:tetratricopeptide repeat protein [Archangium gephyra]|nr:tetratricopeptide repeat protein [Archangium gephyra]